MFWLAIVVVLFFAGSYVWHLTQTGQVVFSLKQPEVIQELASKEENSVAEEPTPDETVTETIFVEEMLEIQAKMQEDDSVLLSWTPFQGENFRFYKIVRSETNPDPRYPEDGSLAYAGDQNRTEYRDTQTEAGKTYYYRACAKLDKGFVACGNVLKFETLKPATEESVSVLEEKSNEEITGN